MADPTEPTEALRQCEPLGPDGRRFCARRGCKREGKYAPFWYWRPYRGPRCFRHWLLRIVWRYEP